MSVNWPPSSLDEGDLYRDEATRLPTALYPFYIRDRSRKGDKLDHWLVTYEPRDGTKGKDIGTAADIFSAFRLMLDAYERWFPTRPLPRVYFIGEELRVGAMVKIGYSANPQMRLRQLQTSSPVRLQILATVPGDETTERIYHRRWSSRRRAGEWFVLGDCIINEIARLNQTPDRTTDRRRV